MTYPINPRDVAFMAAVHESELQLAEIAKGWQPPCTAADLRKARDDAFRAMANDLPDPAEYASTMAPEIAAALMDAVHGRNGGLWAADGPLVPSLRSMGLIAINDRQLTDFAMRVRYAMREAAGEYVPPVKRRPVSRKPRALTASEMGSSDRGRPKRNFCVAPADVRRVEHSAPCHRCGCRMDACECRSARL